MNKLKVQPLIKLVLLHKIKTLKPIKTTRRTNNNKTRKPQREKIYNSKIRKPRKTSKFFKQTKLTKKTHFLKRKELILTEILSARLIRSEKPDSLSLLHQESPPALTPLFSKKSLTIKAKSCSLSWLNPHKLLLLLLLELVVLWWSPEATHKLHSIIATTHRRRPITTSRFPPYNSHQQ